jgi:hypothetical protein
MRGTLMRAIGRMTAIAPGREPLQRLPSIGDGAVE